MYNFEGFTQELCLFNTDTKPFSDMLFIAFFNNYVLTLLSTILCDNTT